MLESDQELLPIYAAMKKQSKRERNDLAFDKANSAYSEVARRAEATKDLIRRFSSIMEGGKPRNKQLASIACAWFVKERTKTQAVP